MPDTDLGVRGGSWAGLVSLIASMAVYGPVFLVACLVAAIGATFPFGAFELGVVIALFYAIGAVTAVFAAVWVDRVGARVVLVVSTLVTAASTAACAFAQSWQMLALLFAIGGCSGGTVGPAAIRLLMSAVAPNRRAMAIALRQSAPPMMAVLIGVFAALAQTRIGWRATFVGYAVLAVLIAVATFVGGHEGTAIKRAPDNGRLHAQTQTLLIIASTLMGASISTFSGFIVAGGIAVGITPDDAAWLLAWSSIAAIAARLAGGWAADRRKGGHLLRVALLLVLGAVSCVAIAFAGRAALYIPAVIAVSMTAWSSNALYTYAVVNRQAHAPARATGILQLGGFGGSAIGPFVFGFVVERSGQTAAWLFLAAWLLLAAGVVWQARRDWMLRTVRPGK